MLRNVTFFLLDISLIFLSRFRFLTCRKVPRWSTLCEEERLYSHEWLVDGARCILFRKSSYRLQLPMRLLLPFRWQSSRTFAIDQAHPWWSVKRHWKVPKEISEKQSIGCGNTGQQKHLPNWQDEKPWKDWWVSKSMNSVLTQRSSKWHRKQTLPDGRLPLCNSSR